MAKIIARPHPTRAIEAPPTITDRDAVTRRRITPGPDRARGRATCALVAVWLLILAVGSSSRLSKRTSSDVKTARSNDAAAVGPKASGGQQAPCTPASPHRRSSAMCSRVISLNPMSSFGSARTAPGVEPVGDAVRTLAAARRDDSPPSRVAQRVVEIREAMPVGAGHVPPGVERVRSDLDVQPVRFQVTNCVFHRRSIKRARRRHEPNDVARPQPARPQHRYLL
jgi:hypothetical protein